MSSSRNNKLRHLKLKARGSPFIRRRRCWSHTCQHQGWSTSLSHTGGAYIYIYKRRNTVLANGVMVTFSWWSEYLTCNNILTNVIYSIFNNDFIQTEFLVQHSKFRIASRIIWGNGTPIPTLLDAVRVLTWSLKRWKSEWETFKEDSEEKRVKEELQSKQNRF